MTRIEYRRAVCALLGLHEPTAEIAERIDSLRAMGYGINQSVDLMREVLAIKSSKETKPK